MFLEKVGAIRVGLLSALICCLACGGENSAGEGESEAETEAEGECSPEGCDDGVECTDDHWDEENCECVNTPLQGRCSDGTVCNPGACAAGCCALPPCAAPAAPTMAGRWRAVAAA